MILIRYCQLLPFLCRFLIYIVQLFQHNNIFLMLLLLISVLKFIACMVKGQGHMAKGDLIYVKFIFLLKDWLFSVLHPTQEYFTYIETSPLLVKGCKIKVCARRSGPLSRERSLSCHICGERGLGFPVSSEGLPPLVASYDVEDLF